MGQVALADGGEAGNVASEALHKKGYLSVCEPCVGSGGMVLGFAKAMYNNKMNYCDQMVAYCCDIDIKCVHMAYLQLSLYGIPAVIIHGNSLHRDTRTTSTPCTEFFEPFFSAFARKYLDFKLRCIIIG